MEIPNVFTGYGSPFLDGRKYAKMADLAVDTGLKGSFFHIDDLLNFSNEEIAGPIEENGNNWANDVTADSSTVTVMETPSRKSPANTNSFGTSNALETDGHCTADFFIPCDDLAELEWLSNFVEDSISMETTPEPVFSPNLAAQKADQQGPDSNEDSNSCSGKTSSFSPEISVPGRARSKRPRPHISSNWYSHMFTQGSVPEPQTSANSLSINAGLCSKSTILDGAEYGLPEKLKQVKSSKPGTRKKTPENIHARRCMHCGIQRTPQWRAGPMGPKTLCNACGVRYKSGRLLPEYRPAASPTFVPSEHSNSHKKVLQMRHQKESTEPLELPEKSSDDEYFLLHTTDRRDFSCHLI